MKSKYDRNKTLQYDTRRSCSTTTPVVSDGCVSENVNKRKEKHKMIRWTALKEEAKRQKFKTKVLNRVNVNKKWPKTAWKEEISEKLRTIRE